MNVAARMILVVVTQSSAEAMMTTARMQNMTIFPIKALLGFSVKLTYLKRCATFDEVGQ